MIHGNRHIIHKVRKLLQNCISEFGIIRFFALFQIKNIFQPHLLKEKALRFGFILLFLGRKIRKQTFDPLYYTFALLIVRHTDKKKKYLHVHVTTRFYTSKVGQMLFIHVRWTNY